MIPLKSKLKANSKDIILRNYFVFFTLFYEHNVAVKNCYLKICRKLISLCELSFSSNIDYMI
jgi:hypothetical protein